MNPLTSTSQPPSPSQPGLEKYFIHHFNYNVDNLEENVAIYKKKYIDIIGVTPEVILLKDNNKTLYVKLYTKQEIIHNLQNLNELAKYGIELKLSNTQSDQNSIFCLGIPAALCKIKTDKLIKSIEDNHGDLKVMDIYMLPLKSNEQAITSAKITLATQEMVEKTLATGLTIHKHKVNITQISRAKVLGTPQCFKCFGYEHETNNCNEERRCLHCSKHHLYKDCPNKTKKSTCANCKGAHKSNSNRCSIRKKYLIVPVSKKDREIVVIKNPESTYNEAAIPTTNPWFKKTNHQENERIDRTPIIPAPSSQPSSQNMPSTSYSDCFTMALKFVNPFEAFIEIQEAFGLKVVKMPDSLKNKLKPEFGGEIFVPPPEESSARTREVQASPSSAVNNLAQKNNSPSTSTPRTKTQKKNSTPAVTIEHKSDEDDTDSSSSDDELPNVTITNVTKSNENQVPPDVPYLRQHTERYLKYMEQQKQAALKQKKGKGKKK